MLKAGLVFPRLTMRQFYCRTSIMKTSTISQNTHEAPKKDVTANQILKNMMQSVWPKGNFSIKARVVLSLALLASSKALNVCVPFIYKHLIDSFGIPKDGQLLSFLGSLDFIKVSSALILLYGITRISSGTLNELRGAVFATVSQHSLRLLSRKMFLHLHSLDLAFHLENKTAALTKVVDRGSRGLSFALNALVFNVVPTILEVSLVTAILYYNFGLKYSIVALSFVSCYAVFTLLITAWRTKFRLRMNEADQKSGEIIIDSLINFETVKHFNSEEHEANRNDKFLARFEKENIKSYCSLSLLNAGQGAIVSIGMITLMGMVSNQISKGEMSIGDLVLVNTLLFQLAIPLSFLGSVYRDIKQSLVDMDKMFKILYLNPKVCDHINAFPRIKMPENLPPSIEFENVTFGYNTNDLILKKLSFRIEGGQKVAFIGASGSGKSTILRLLYRFYDPIDGRILINNQDIKKVKLTNLRRIIGIVPQDVVLFQDTVLYNLQYGNRQASFQNIVNATKIANIYDSIQSWPQTFNTKTGQRGLQLSGGEKQRIGIARTILKDPQIFGFDEATSNIDNITELKIQQALNTFSEKRTGIFIAHRLSTIKKVDNIFVLSDGKIVENGSPAHLESFNSVYKSLIEKKISQ